MTTALHALHVAALMLTGATLGLGLLLAEVIWRHNNHTTEGD